MGDRGLSVFFLAVGFGLVTASILTLAAVGLTLQFGITNYVNFAYGEFLTLGAYLAWVLNWKLHLNLWLAMVGAALLVGLVGVAINYLLLRPFVRKGIALRYILIVTFGLSLILSNVILAIWGANYQSFDVGSQLPFHAGPFLFTPNQVLITLVALCAMLGVHLLLSRTRLGKAMRAMSDNHDLAMVSGIDNNRITAFTWLLSGTLAGLAGVVLALDVTSFQPLFGNDFLFVIFAAMILGGVGSPYGAMLGSLVIGLATEISAVVVNSAFKDDIAFAVLIAVLLLRPQGIMRIAGRG
jgi:branched-chain amino acid transport system permease protein/neutral amino acid transport system permease protein